MRAIATPFRHLVRLHVNPENYSSILSLFKKIKSNLSPGYDLRTTLDILIADESFRSTQLALAQSQCDRLSAEAALLRAIGSLTASSFDESPASAVQKQGG